MTIFVPPIRINEVFPDPDNAYKDHYGIAEDCCREDPTISRIKRFIRMIASEADYDSRKDQVH